MSRATASGRETVTAWRASTSTACDDTRSAMNRWAAFVTASAGLAPIR